MLRKLFIRVIIDSEDSLLEFGVIKRVIDIVTEYLYEVYFPVNQKNKQMRATSHPSESECKTTFPIKCSDAGQPDERAVCKLGCFLSSERADM